MSDQVWRIVKILSWLSAGEKLTTTEILDRLREADQEFKEVETRTIQRDIKQMRDAGAAIEMSRDGKQQRYYIPRHQAILHSMPAAASPLLALHMLKAALPQFEDIDLGVDLSELIDNVGKRADGNVVDLKLVENVTLGLHLEEVSPDILHTIIRAISSERWIDIKYATTKHRMTVFPYRLIPYIGRLYLASWMAKYERFQPYALDKIIDVKMLQKAPAKAPKFSIETFMQNRFGLWDSDHVAEVVVHVDEEAAPALGRRRWHPTQQTQPIDGGGLEIKMTTGLSHELVSWILHWAPHITVIEPEELRSLVVDRHLQGLQTQKK